MQYPFLCFLHIIGIDGLGGADRVRHRFRGDDAMGSFFQVYKSFGLFWVREYDFHNAESEVILHGPFMDVRDAYAECGKPTNWRVAFS